MAIAKMKLVEIEFPEDQSDVILSKLVDSEDFHPEPASKFADSVRGLTVLNRPNPYADLLARMDEAKSNLGLTLDDAKPQMLDIAQADALFCDVVDQANKIDKLQKDLQQMINENNEAITQLKNMQDDHLNLDQLFTSHYLQIRYGYMPTMNLDKLKYYDDQVFLFKPFFKDGKYCYCLYMTTETHAPEVDNIFSSLYFERIHIPSFVHGTPKEAIGQLEEENDAAKKNIEKYESRKQKLFADNKADLSTIYATCKENAETSEAQKYVVVFGQQAAIYGFCEDKYAKKLKKEFEVRDDVKVEIKPPMGDSRLTPPTKLKENWFSKPFGMFVEMYGVPAYTDMDPTNFVAISYCILFGIMFGDVGQGAVLILVGFLAWKLKKLRLGLVGTRIGVFSIIFGCLFGSVFGSEEILTPFFMPMKSTNTMPLLLAAIGIGVLLIIISMSFNVYINAKKKNWGEFLFSQNGVAGLAFYICVILLAINALGKLGLPLGTPYIVVGIVLPILLIFLKEPLNRKMQGYKMFPEGFGSFFTEGFFELFDVVLTFITNTMSFLRVGGFVLSHAGMMLVVYTLAEMIGGVGYWITLVLGNAFVMCLEGMIVGIQVLRLEFYEMFSRYYEGNGKPFISMKENLEK
ncbi:V-type ATP synthase subunit I [Intestinibaculum porci]|uniref:V-type ATP synthase subunit I n=1 Tax=Intestinibaculum porci TaxID=2487118 RepID=UPI00240A0A42|nr:V-type ATPase 116kDa subunit family protein [Intestinibaculum porci]MDD6348516.1 V-type ATPase 116kDa subunit family protein [Intestinibaculum porci]MDD6423068.1 V-type ATPase 116kDa subunit family protein [Intestinibaculum porci]